ncbi:MAG: hypothetical protein ACFFC7_04910 [Candidatus Hermodarchaeota archaeon]
MRIKEALMILKEKVLYVASLFSFISALFAYLYESRTTYVLPIITYPLRIYVIPLALIALIFLVLALIVQTENETNAFTKSPILWGFVLTFLLIGFIMKILGEVVHELLGHGFFCLLFGGQIHSYYISLLWPYELSNVSCDISYATPSQRIWVLAGGILNCLILSYLFQILLLWKQTRWQFSLPLFWFSFWCYINSTGYLIIGGVSPFGDVAALIAYGVLVPPLALLIGTGLFLIGFFLLSEILCRTLTPVLGEQSSWGVFIFWFIIPVLVGLTMLGQGMFNILFIFFSIVPVLLSYLLEFQLKGNKDIFLKIFNRKS